MTPPVQPEQDPEGVAFLSNVLTILNAERRKGRSMKELDEYTMQEYGMPYKEFGRKVGKLRAGPEIHEMTSKDIYRMELYGATLGWLDEIEGLIGLVKGTGYKKARDNARKEIKRFEREYPTTAKLLKYGGAAAGTAAGGVLVRAAQTGAGMMSAGAALGAAETGGGVLGGEPQNMIERGGRMAVGSLLGGAGAAMAQPGNVAAGLRTGWRASGLGTEGGRKAATGLLKKVGVPVGLGGGGYLLGKKKGTPNIFDLMEE